MYVNSFSCHHDALPQIRNSARTHQDGWARGGTDPHQLLCTSRSFLYFLVHKMLPYSVNVLLSFFVSLHCALLRCHFVRYSDFPALHPPLSTVVILCWCVQSMVVVAAEPPRPKRDIAVVRLQRFVRAKSRKGPRPPRQTRQTRPAQQPQPPPKALTHKKRRGRRQTVRAISIARRGIGPVSMY